MATQPITNDSPPDNLSPSISVTHENLCLNASKIALQDQHLYLSKSFDRSQIMRDKTNRQPRSITVDMPQVLARCFIEDIV